MTRPYLSMDNYYQEGITDSEERFRCTHRNRMMAISACPCDFEKICSMKREEDGRHKRYNRKPDPRRIPIDDEVMLRMRREGKYQWEIAKHFGVCRPLISRRLKEIEFARMEGK